MAGGMPEGEVSAGSWTDRRAVTGEYALKVLAYTDCIARTVVKAKEPGFDETGWDELASMLDVDSFRRVGNDMVPMGWEVYRGLLMMWSTVSDFHADLHRITQVGNRVYLELTEHNEPRGGTETVVNSCTVYQFDEAGKLVHLDIYLQHD